MAEIVKQAKPKKKNNRKLYKTICEQPILKTNILPSKKLESKFYLRDKVKSVP